MQLLKLPPYIANLTLIVVNRTYVICKLSPQPLHVQQTSRVEDLHRDLLLYQVSQRVYHWLDPTPRKTRVSLISLSFSVIIIFP